VCWTASLSGCSVVASCGYVLKLFAWIPPSSKSTPTGQALEKKRPPSHRSQPRRLEYQTAYGCRGCASCPYLEPDGRPGWRCAARQAVDSSAWPSAWTRGAADGQRLPGRSTLELAASLGFIPVVPPSPQRLKPWDYDKHLYRRRNQIERLFRRVKEWRRVFTRYDKFDFMFAAFITVALIAEALR